MGDETIRAQGELALLRSLGPQDAATLRRIRATPEVARWWGPAEDDFPSADDPDATRLAILVDGEVGGMIQFGEQPDPESRHAWIDIYVDPELHDRGIGTDSVATLARHLLEQRGHHRITIDPVVANAPAIRCYEKAGFAPVGILHSAWRDPVGEWRDVLLMELVRF
ncbi:MAG: GNAT family N-acetyltransferase [Thermoleophilaceae bacterium]